MKPLNVALVVKNTPSGFERDGRSKGYFSYEVPEFTWQHFTLGDTFRWDVDKWGAIGFDLVIQEDGGNWGEYIGDLPRVFIVIDSTLSQKHHLTPRQNHALQFHLTLVDHDKLDRYPVGRTHRLSHCANDKVFYDRGYQRNIDVSFHCANRGPGDGTRGKIRHMLHDWAKDKGKTYTSGAKGLDEYAMNMSRSKIVVNWPRTSENRPHRVFDSMACGACLVTGKLPEVSDEIKEAGKDYIEVENYTDIPSVLDALLNPKAPAWEDIAASGHALVHTHHTWAVRAKELRELLKEELGI